MMKIVFKLSLISLLLAFSITSSMVQTEAYVDTLYIPAKEDPTPGSMYPRVICLEHQEGKGNGVLLATFEPIKYFLTFKTLYSINYLINQTWEILTLHIT